MEERASAAQIAAAFETWRGYLGDLIDAKFDEFQTKLRLFVNYCEKDDVLRHLSTLLLTLPGVDGKRWYEEVAAGEKEPLVPEQPAERASLSFQVLHLLKTKRIDLRAFLANSFPGTSVDAKLKELQKRLVGGHRDALGRRIGEAIAAIKEDDRVPVATWMRNLLADLAAAGAAPAAPAAAPPPPASTPRPGEPASAADSPEQLIARLGGEVAGAASLAADVRSDLGKDVEILKLELAKHRPKLQRAHDILGDIGSHGVAGEAIQALKRRIEGGTAGGA